MSARLRNIIFDLGGVLINIDYARTKDAFEALGFNKFEAMYSQYTADALFSDLETGKISDSDFYSVLMKQEPYLSENDLRNAWNAMLLEFRLGSLSFLEDLRQRYNLYLLSNTNVIHRAAFKTIFREQTGFESLDNFFTRSWYSDLVGLRKPNEDIFEFVLEDADLKANETLFIDDSYNNIETAKKLGFETHLLVPGELIENLEYS